MNLPALRRKYAHQRVEHRHGADAVQQARGHEAFDEVVACRVGPGHGLGRQRGDALDALLDPVAEVFQAKLDLQQLADDAADHEATDHNEHVGVVRKDAVVREFGGVHPRVDRHLEALRDHGEAAQGNPRWTPADTVGRTICMHAAEGPRRSQTTGSLVSEIGGPATVHWVTGSAAPCIACALARSSGVKSIRLSTVMAWRAYAGGLVGNGCVGELSKRPVSGR